MLEVAPGLYVGAMYACSLDTSDRAIVHACKVPCHQQAVGYAGSLPRSHPEYLVAPRGNHLYLNIVDMVVRQEHRFMAPILGAALDFIGAWYGKLPVVVHCNEGRSRSPTIAMLYLAKRAGRLPDEGVAKTVKAFSRLYPPYDPGQGLASYLRRHWDDIR